MRILALDYGRSRIGVALADSAVGLAQPLCTLERINRNEDMRRLREMAREHGVKQIVVGLPLRLDGTRGEMAEEAEGFAQRLRKQVGVPVEMVDERLTSWEAERLLEEVQGRVIKSPASPGQPREKRSGPRQRGRRGGGGNFERISGTAAGRRQRNVMPKTQLRKFNTRRGDSWGVGDHRVGRD